MKMAKRTLMLGIALAIVMNLCHAASFGFLDFKASVNLAAIVARVEITSTDAIKFDGGSSKICGYRIHARIEELFKGPKTREFTFYSGSDSDILEGYSEYFVIVNPRASSSAETSIDGGKCDTRGIDYAVNSFFQTVFAIQDDPSNKKPEFLLVSRHSPFTTGNFVGPYKYIETFGIENDRIYALVSWGKVITSLHNWMVTEQEEKP